MQKSRLLYLIAIICEIQRIMQNPVFKITFKIQKFSQGKYCEFSLSMCMSVSVFPAPLESSLWFQSELTAWSFQQFHWDSVPSNNLLTSTLSCSDGHFSLHPKGWKHEAWLFLPTHPHTNSRFFPSHHQLGAWRNFLRKREKIFKNKMQIGSRLSSEYAAIRRMQHSGEQINL